MTELEKKLREQMRQQIGWPADGYPLTDALLTAEWCWDDMVMAATIGAELGRAERKGEISSWLRSDAAASIAYSPTSEALDSLANAIEYGTWNEND